LLTTVILVCNVLPYYTFVAAGLFVSFGIFQWLYMNTIQTLKHLASETNSPIFAHISETLNGIAVVRAFRAQERFKAVNSKYLERNHKIQFNLDHTQLWNSFWLDNLGSCLVFATALFCVSLADTLPTQHAGLAISNSIQTLIFFTLMVRGAADIQSQSSSVELISYVYTQNTPVEKEGAEEEIPPNWPSEGKIEFQGVTMR
jgi:ABC-type multidrug transport system fused ATPase/permease subunit